VSKVNYSGNVISKGDNNSVIALGKDVAAKVFELGGTSGREELYLLETANAINGLLVKVRELCPSDDYEHDLLIMERLYPLAKRALSKDERVALGEKFLSQVKELHEAGFAHWDIKRPSTIRHGGPWDNVIITREAVRLIDCGISVLSDHPEFEEACEHDIESSLEWIDTVLM
jgi:tRNA A-37 threonylcarbamoyl transferase component Bud32